LHALRQARLDDALSRHVDAQRATTRAAAVDDNVIFVATKDAVNDTMSAVNGGDDATPLLAADDVKIDITTDDDFAEKAATKDVQNGFLVDGTDGVNENDNASDNDNDILSVTVEQHGGNLSLGERQVGGVRCSCDVHLCSLRT
jgi:hypothetical protein